MTHYADESTVAELLRQLGLPEQLQHRLGRDPALHGLRGIIADALQDMGRDREANLLRREGQHVMTLPDGRVVPGRPGPTAAIAAARELGHFASQNGVYGSDFDPWSDSTYLYPNQAVVDREYGGPVAPQVPPGHAHVVHMEPFVQEYTVPYPELGARMSDFFADDAFQGWLQGGQGDFEAQPWHPGFRQRLDALRSAPWEEEDPTVEYSQTHYGDVDDLSAQALQNPWEGDIRLRMADAFAESGNEQEALFQEAVGRWLPERVRFGNNPTPLVVDHYLHGPHSPSEAEPLQWRTWLEDEELSGGGRRHLLMPRFSGGSSNVIWDRTLSEPLAPSFASEQFFGLPRGRADSLHQIRLAVPHLNRDNFRRLLNDGERAYLGLDYLDPDTDPAIWPQIEAILRERHRLGHRFAEDDDPTNYTDLPGPRTFDEAPTPRPRTLRRKKPFLFEENDDPLGYGVADDANAFNESIRENPLELTNHLVFADWLGDQGWGEEEAFRRAVASGLDRRLQTPWQMPRFSVGGWMLENGPHGPNETAVPANRLGMRHGGQWWARHFAPAMADEDDVRPTGSFLWGEVNNNPLIGDPDPNQWRTLLGLSEFENPQDFMYHPWMHNRFARPDYRDQPWGADPWLMMPEERLWSGLEDWNNLDPAIWPQLEALMRREHGRGTRLEDDQSPTPYGEAEDEAAFIASINQDPLDLLNHDVLADWYADHGRPEEEAFRRNLSQGISRRLNTPWIAPEVDQAGWIRPGAPHGVATEGHTRWPANVVKIPWLRTMSSPAGSGSRNIARMHPALSNGDWDLNEHPEGTWAWGIDGLSTLSPGRSAVAALGLGSDENAEDWERQYWLARRNPNHPQLASGDQSPEVLRPEERLWTGVDDWANMDPALWPQLEALLRRQHGRGERLAEDDEPLLYAMPGTLHAAPVRSLVREGFGDESQDGYGPDAAWDQFGEQGHNEGWEEDGWQFDDGNFAAQPQLGTGGSFERQYPTGYATPPKPPQQPRWETPGEYDDDPFAAFEAKLTPQQRAVAREIEEMMAGPEPSGADMKIMQGAIGHFLQGLSPELRQEFQQLAEAQFNSPQQPQNTPTAPRSPVQPTSPHGRAQAQTSGDSEPVTDVDPVARWVNPPADGDWSKVQPPNRRAQDGSNGKLPRANPLALGMFDTDLDADGYPSAQSPAPVQPQQGQQAGGDEGEIPWTPLGADDVELFDPMSDDEFNRELIVNGLPTQGRTWDEFMRRQGEQKRAQQPQPQEEETLWGEPYPTAHPAKQHWSDDGYHPSWNPANQEAPPPRKDRDPTKSTAPGAWDWAKFWDYSAEGAPTMYGTPITKLTRFNPSFDTSGLDPQHLAAFNMQAVLARPPFNKRMVVPWVAQEVDGRWQWVMEAARRVNDSQFAASTPPWEEIPDGPWGTHPMSPADLWAHDLPGGQAPDAPEVDWRPNEAIPEDFYGYSVNYGDREALEAQIAHSPLDVDPHLMLADWWNEQGDEQEALFREGVGRSVQRRLANPLVAAPRMRILGGGDYLDQPHPHGPLDPFYQDMKSSMHGHLWRASPALALGQWNWRLNGPHDVDDETEAGPGVPTVDNWLDPRRWGYGPGTADVLDNRRHLLLLSMDALTRADEFYAGIDDLTTIPPEMWPLVEQIMRDQHGRGLRFDDEEEPTAYGWDEDRAGFLSEVHSNPLDVTGHLSHSDFLADQLGEEHPDVRFRRDLSKVLDTRLSTPWVDKTGAVGGSGHPFDPSVRGFSPHNIPAQSVWTPEPANPLWGAGYFHSRLNPAWNAAGTYLSEGDGFTAPGWMWASRGNSRHVGDPAEAGMEPGNEWRRWVADRSGMPYPSQANNDETSALVNAVARDRSTRLTPAELGAFDFQDPESVDPAIWPQIEALLRGNWNRFEQFEDDEAPVNYAATEANTPTHYAEDIGAAFRALAANPEDRELALALTDWVQEFAPHMMPLVDHIRSGTATFGYAPAGLHGMGEFGPFKGWGAEEWDHTTQTGSGNAHVFFQPTEGGETRTSMIGKKQYNTGLIGRDGNYQTHLQSSGWNEYPMGWNLNLPLAQAEELIGLIHQNMVPRELSPEELAALDAPPPDEFVPYPDDQYGPVMSSRYESDAQPTLYAHDRPFGPGNPGGFADLPLGKGLKAWSRGHGMPLSWPPDKVGQNRGGWNTNTLFDLEPRGNNEAAFWMPTSKGVQRFVDDQDLEQLLAPQYLDWFWDPRDRDDDGVVDKYRERPSAFELNRHILRQLFPTEMFRSGMWEHPFGDYINDPKDANVREQFGDFLDEQGFDWSPVFTHEGRLMTPENTDPVEWDLWQDRIARHREVSPMQYPTWAENERLTASRIRDMQQMGAGPFAPPEPLNPAETDEFGQPYADDSDPTDYADFPTRMITDDPPLPRLRRKKKGGNYFGYADDREPLDYSLPEQRAWLERIAKNWQDSNEHAVFADWLEEHGDPREAAFRRALAEWMQGGGQLGRTPNNNLTVSENGVPYWFDMMRTDNYIDALNEALVGNWPVEHWADLPMPDDPASPSWLTWNKFPDAEESFRENWNRANPVQFSRQTNYGPDEWGNDFLRRNPLDTTALAVSADALEDYGDFDEAAFRRAADEYLRERLSSPWGGPPQTDDGGVLVDPEYPFSWPFHSRGGYEGVPTVQSYKPRLSSDEMLEVHPELANSWWWGFSAHPNDSHIARDKSPEELGALAGFGPEGLPLDAKLRELRRREPAMRATQDLTATERAFGGITDLSQITPEEYLEVLNLMRRRRAELGHFEDDDDPTNYAKLPKDHYGNLEGVMQESPRGSFDKGNWGPPRDNLNPAFYGLEDDYNEFQSRIATDPLELTNHGVFADFLADNDHPDAGFRREVFDSLTRRMGAPWSAPTLEHDYLRQPNPHGPVDPFYQTVRIDPSDPEAHQLAPHFLDLPAFSEQPWNWTYRPSVKAPERAGLDPSLSHWFQTRRAGGWPGVAATDQPGIMSPAERVYAGIDDLRNIDPAMWPLIEQIMRDQSGRGLRFEDADEPTNYGDREDLLGAMAQNPWEGDIHLRLADLEAEQGNEAEALFREKVGRWLPERMANPPSPVFTNNGTRGSRWFGPNPEDPLDLRTHRPGHSGRTILQSVSPYVMPGGNPLMPVWVNSGDQIRTSDGSAISRFLGTAPDDPFAGAFVYHDWAPARPLHPGHRAYLGLENLDPNTDPALWPQIETILRHLHRRKKNFADDDQPTPYAVGPDGLSGMSPAQLFDFLVNTRGIDPRRAAQFAGLGQGFDPNDGMDIGAFGGDLGTQGQDGAFPGGAPLPVDLNLDEEPLRYPPNVLDEEPLLYNPWC